MRRATAVVATALLILMVVLGCMKVQQPPSQERQISIEPHEVTPTQVVYGEVVTVTTVPDTPEYRATIAANNEARRVEMEAATATAQANSPLTVTIGLTTPNP